jgi:predicted peroxiredoxin
MPNSQRNNLLINLISDRPANIAKALRFGRKFLAAGWKVTLLVNIDGVQLVNPAADLAPCPVTGEPLPKLLAAYQAEGGDVLVGKECLKLARMQVDQLPPGAEVASFPRTEALMATPDLKIITW